MSDFEYDHCIEVLKHEKLFCMFFDMFYGMK